MASQWNQSSEMGAITAVHFRGRDRARVAYLTHAQPRVSIGRNAAFAAGGQCPLPGTPIA